MDELEKKINTFKKIRKDYFIYYESWKIQNQNQKDENQTTISTLGLTLDELISLSETSQIIPQQVKQERNEFGVILHNPESYRFTNCVDYRLDYIKPLKSKVTYHSLFKDCVTIIYNMGIQINHIEVKTIKEHHPTIFIYHCIKNECHFQFECYENDSDYYLAVYKTINKEEIKHHFVFHIDQLNDNYDYKKFIAAINNINMNDFKQALYSHIIALPQLLASHYEYTIYIDDTYFKTDNSDEIEYKIYINIGPSFAPKKCVLTAKDHDTLILSKEEVDFRKEYYEIPYKSTKDFNQLVEYTTAFMNRQYGYGYKSNSKYGNDIDFTKRFPDLKVEVIRNIDNLSGFDLYTVIGGYEANPEALMSFINMPIHGQSCILDYYGIRLLYDRRIDPLNCILTIDCKMCDISTLKPSNYHVEYYPYLTSFHNIKIHDSYINCIKMIQKLIAMLK